MDEQAPEERTFKHGDMELTIPRNILCGASWTAMRQAIKNKRHGYADTMITNARKLLEAAETEKQKEGAENMLAQASMLNSRFIDDADINDAIFDPEIFKFAVATVTDMTVDQAGKFLNEYFDYGAIARDVYRVTSVKNSENPDRDLSDGEKKPSPPTTQNPSATEQDLFAGNTD